MTAAPTRRTNMIILATLLVSTILLGPTTSASIIIERQPTTLVTTPSASDVAVGTPVTDHANVTATREIGEVSLAAHVSFYICAVDVVPCTSGGAFLGNVTVDNGTADSPPFTPTAPGTYCFRGEYSGDVEYAPSQDASEGECFTAHLSVPFFPTTTALALSVVGAAGVVGATLVVRKR